MPAQTTEEKFIFPDGMELSVSTDDGTSWTDLGTLGGGATCTYNYDKSEIVSGNNGTIRSRVKNETIALAPSALWSWNAENLEKISGGLITSTTDSSAGYIIKAGSTSTTLDRFYARLRHYTDTAKTDYDIEFEVYGVEMDSGMEFNFKGAEDDGLSEITVSFTGNVDTSKSDGEGLFKAIIKDTALGTSD